MSNSTSDRSTVDNVDVAFAAVQVMMRSVIELQNAVLRSRMENRAMTDEELGALLTAEQLQAAKEEAAIRKAEAEGR